MTGDVKLRGSHAAGAGWRTARSQPPSPLVLFLWLAGLTAAVIVMGFLIGQRMSLIPFLIFLPVFVAGRGTVRQTALITAGVVLIVLCALPFQSASPAEKVAEVAFAAVLGALSVVICRNRIRKEEEIVRLRSAAAALQRQLLRPLPLRTDRLVAEGLYEPVEEDSRIGGDVYEMIASPYGTRVLLADVQGTGLPAIGTAFAVLGAFREAAIREPELTGVVAALEDATLRHNAFSRRVGEPERFVTALVLDVGGDRTALAVNCGHPPPLLLDPDRVRPALRHDPEVPLGLGALAARPRAVEEFDFPDGATLLLYTDGLIEAKDASDRFYPLRERLADRRLQPSGRLVRGIWADLLRYTGGEIQDDVAILALRRVTS
ncbi:PP2C family protein-serine/threonine phosphatase [Thermostaphylospora chromogena]|uniref:Stage II sporulation protein E (SpoIIE) n=1 Tax=Thermostaphylospora chromogena TaxID=35622 RepID=A0A1H1HVW8_9ACTN|nr:PP2C family protein-serine/threonine phosphatase [Thermostaphylospora chromogena]SDR29563.1 Stage II sporulation protein E (SpoIIE) [Thermostaphylospora chromogena]